MSESRAILEQVYRRLRMSTAASAVSADQLRSAALEALERAKIQIEVDTAWVQEQLERLESESRAEDAAGAGGDEDRQAER